MSFEKTQYKQEVNQKDCINVEEEDKNNNKVQENELLLKPIAIKHNILSNYNQSLNKHSSVSVFPNQPTQFINDINQINYIKNKDSEMIKYNSIESEKGVFSLYQNYNKSNSNNNIDNNKNESVEKNSKIHCTCKKTKCIKKYCECFSSGVLCYNCKCENCENKSYLNDNTTIKNLNKENKKEEE